jgi:lipid-binding SYLF domain-containing protein
MNKTGLGGLLCGVALLLGSAPGFAADSSKAAQLDRDGRAAVNRLIASNAGAKAVSQKAVAVLVFPSITKAGLMIGGQYGDGVLLKRGKTAGYYNTSGASYGLQAGAQTYGYAMFFMNDGALRQLDKTEGFEVGVGPSVVVADEGFGKTTSSITYDKDIYAFIFSQQGLMAGLGLQGNKITRIKP